MDDGIEKALRIGKANAEVINLAQNWCANLQVEKFGGTGLVEVETGLPIGTRRFKCAHASAEGFAGMDLRSIALDFYDRNCNGCQKRVPVMLPNLSQLVGEREKAAEADRRKREAHAERERSAYEQRRAKRDILSQRCDESTLALFEAVDSLDREPTPEKAEVLTQLAALTPERFQGALQEALFALVNETSSSAVANGVLTALRQIKANPDAMCSTALRVLAQAALPIAGSIVAENVAAAHVAAVESALPSLISLAVPFEDYFRRQEPEKHPEGLLAVYRIAPAIVTRVLERLLGEAAKLPRIQAVRAIQVLRQADSSFGIELIPALVRSTALPDNHYDIGSAEGWAQDLLADLLESHFEKVDPALTECFGKLQDQDSDVGLDKVYLRLYRSHRHGGKQSRRTSRAHEIIFGRLVSYLATDCAEQASLQLLEFLRHDAEAYVHLVERHIDGLLGAMAVIAEQRTKTVTSSLQLHLPPDPLAVLEASSRKNALYWLIDAIAQLVGKTAKERPETIGRTLLSTLAQIGDAHDELRAGLVMALGEMAENREMLPEILPYLYSAMTGRSQLVRAAAARAYGEVIDHSPDDFPPLLHETFITLLSDPYVVVHSAALNVLDRTHLPKEYDGRLRLMALQAIAAHSGTEGNKHVLKTAIEVFLDFHVGEDKPLPNAIQDAIIERILRCDAYDAANLLTRHASQLIHQTGFTKAVLAILKDEDTSEHTIEELLRMLRRVPEAQLRSQADEFVAVMETCSENGYYVVDAAVEILTAAGLWQHAMQLAEREEKHWDDSEWDRPRKLMSQLRTLGCAVEFYSSVGNVAELKECLAAIRLVEEERLKDEAKHRERRDSQFGLAD